MFVILYLNAFFYTIAVLSPGFYANFCSFVWLIFATVLGFVSCSSPDPWLSAKPSRNSIFNRNTVGFDNQLSCWCYKKKRHRLRLSFLDDGNLNLNCSFPGFGRHSLSFSKSRRSGLLLPFASADDAVTVNGNPRTSATEVEELRVKLDQPLQGEDYCTGLVQSLHDAARVFELAIREQNLSSKISWFSTAWIGIDKTAWIKELSYQVSVLSFHISCFFRCGKQNIIAFFCNCSIFCGQPALRSFCAESFESIWDLCLSCNNLFLDKHLF